MKKAFLGCLLLVTASASATDWYVRKGGQDSNNGSSWKTAFASIGKACYNAQNGDKIYFEADTFAINEPILINKSLTFQGGYQSSASDKTDKRSRKANGKAWEFEKETVFKGNGKVRLIDISRVAGTVHFDGITFTKGFVENPEDNYVLYCGGAIRAAASELTKVENCKFIENKSNKKSDKSNGANGYGGAIYSEASIEILNSYFFKNHANGGFNGGGAINLRPGVGRTAKIDGCVFESNSSTKAGGAAFFAGTSEIKLLNSIFFNNWSSGDEGPNPGGALYVYGVYQTQEPSRALIENCLIYNNYGMSSVFAMGGIYRNITVANNGGNFEFQHKETELYNSIIWGNGINFANNEGIMENMATSQWMEGDVYPNLKDLVKLNNSNKSPNGPNFKNPTPRVGRARNDAHYQALLNADWSLSENSPILGFGASIK